MFNRYYIDKAILTPIPSKQRVELKSCYLKKLFRNKTKYGFMVFNFKFGLFDPLKRVFLTF